MSYTVERTETYTVTLTGPDGTVVKTETLRVTSEADGAGNGGANTRRGTGDLTRVLGRLRDHAMQDAMARAMTDAEALATEGA